MQLYLYTVCYWHRHPDCPNTTTPGTRTKFWQAKFDDTVERDKRNSAELRGHGWRVITVWECELEKDPQGVLDGIRSVLERSV